MPEVAVTGTETARMPGASAAARKPRLPGETIFGHLQSVFKQELPYYMVPSLYFLFDRFPSLPSGKTDTKEILQRVNQRMHEGDAAATRFVCSEAVVCD